MQVKDDRISRPRDAKSNHLPTSSFSTKVEEYCLRSKSRTSSFMLIAKLSLGIFVLSFFTTFQPIFNYPPKTIKVYATQPSAQTQEITPSQNPVQFQLPHPGYLSTPYSSYHPGIDLASGLGMPVQAIASGKVIESGFNFWGLGLVVEIEHEGGFKSLYAHMGKIYVEKGTEVNQGATLGVVGLTGNTSGPHTHLELTKDGNRIDPRPLLPEIRNFPQEEDFTVYESATPSAVLVPASASAKLTTPTPTPSPTPIPSPELSLSLNPTSTASTTLKTDTIAQKIAAEKLVSTLSVTKPSSTPKPQPIGGNLNPTSLILGKIQITNHK